jgi:hypothetical protein
VFHEATAKHDSANSKGGFLMKKYLVVAASIALLSVGACAVGKGKGKAPPPVAAPIVTKG